MLAGILLRLVMAMFEHVPTAPLLVLPLLAAVPGGARLPADARLAGRPGSGRAARLVAGAGEAAAAARASRRSVSTMPAWDVATLVGLGVPLYLVTMASQNLPGFAVLRASGYQPPAQPILAVTGAASLGTAFLGAHTSNLAAISAATLHRARRASRSGAALEGRAVLRRCSGALIALFGASRGRPVRGAAAGAARDRRGHGTAGLDGGRAGHRHCRATRTVWRRPARSPSPSRASP